MNKVFAALAVVSLLSCGAAFANDAKGACAKKHGAHCKASKKAATKKAAVTTATTEAKPAK
jgi:hypothetical protein